MFFGWFRAGCGPRSGLPCSIKSGRRRKSELSLAPFPRSLRPALDLYLSDIPVFCLLGPRQYGKSTLARHCESARSYFSLHDRNHLDFALAKADHKLVRFYLPLVPDDPEQPVWSVVRKLADRIGEGVISLMRTIAQENRLLQGIIDRVGFNTTTDQVRTACRFGNRQCSEATTASSRVRRIDRYFLHHHHLTIIHK